MLIVEKRRRPEWAGLTKLALRRYPPSRGYDVVEALGCFVCDRQRAGLGALARDRISAGKRVMRDKRLDEQGVRYRMRTTMLDKEVRCIGVPHRTFDSVSGELTMMTVMQPGVDLMLSRSFDRSCLSDQEGRDWLARRLRGMRRELQQALLQSNTVVK